MRSELNSDVSNERNYNYKLVRVHKDTGKVEAIGFTPGILYRMDVADSEWRPETS